MAYVSPLVGRDGERTMLAEALRRCRSGRGGVVLISGEAGIGKTRLVDELFGEWEGSCRCGRPPRISSRTSDQRLPHGRLGAKPIANQCATTNCRVPSAPCSYGHSRLFPVSTFLCT